jgi:hypothetical protein
MDYILYLVLIFNSNIKQLLWKIPFFRMDRKFIALQVLTHGKKMPFIEIDRVAKILWAGGESYYMPNESKKFLLYTKTAALSEAERDLKLRHIVLRAKHILTMSGLYVRVCDESEISSYTGWQKDEFEILIELAELSEGLAYNDAKDRLISHPNLKNFLTTANRNGRGDLVSRALTVISSRG